ncbi:flagellar basal-body MS-ring/collar protein FliF [Priestia taiwanensis]|uniref:Flagellar M-ring protein n=1 Tax=Priestia taiwanensis TaxID=1347902 RepID=A0A917AQ23_9BACI|nr:flagellar basal-body MS-ring/collar protein FliF [Priestia taiwanensis]MBM7362844.1 flagellar M-ring protein FliF [Priestia taiwanensis]GGE65580.1 flagellar M-ring protein [Priestia taiwanensis]
MNEKIKGQMGQYKEYWSNRTKKQKGFIIGTLVAVLLVAAGSVYFLTKQTLVPLYSNLSAAEAGQIKEELDAKGVVSQITNNGNTILVPDTAADALKVELASKGIPNSGVIDYSFFGQKSSLSMTDNEFNVVKLEAMQNELVKLMKGIEGIEDAKVMITLPKESIWVSDKSEAASASIVLQTKPGYNPDEKQVKSLYHLVSKSVPNLPAENIVIMNQNFEYYDLDSTNSTSGNANFAMQRNMKKEVERDIQRQVQQLLSTMMGADKVAVVVSADLDFTQENRTEELVEPVDKENMQGIAISAEKIKETYTGNSENEGGTVGTGEDEPAGTGYAAGANNNQNSESNKNHERINYEVNRIKKEIVESPYKVKDLGIQVAVEPPTPGEPASLPQRTVDDIEKMLSSIVKTSISKNDETPLTDEEITNKISVTVSDLKGKAEATTNQATAIPMWVYIVGGVLLLAIILLVVMLVRKKRADSEEIEEEFMEPIRIEDINNEIETEEIIRRKQLEKLAKEKPEEFTKVIRTWLSED